MQQTTLLTEMRRQTLDRPRKRSTCLLTDWVMRHFASNDPALVVVSDNTSAAAIYVTNTSLIIISQCDVIVYVNLAVRAVFKAECEPGILLFRPIETKRSKHLTCFGYR